MELTNDIVFEPELLKKLPLTYHFMVEVKQEEVSEFKNKKRFSVSAPHQSLEYLSRATYKPLSAIALEE